MASASKRKSDATATSCIHRLPPPPPFRALLGAAALLALAGCAGQSANHYVAPPGQPLAQSVLQAAGFGRPTDPSAQTGTDGTSLTLPAASLLGAATRSAMVAGTSMAMTGVAAVTTLGQPDTRAMERPQFIAWMPRTLAPNAESAARRMDELLGEALERAAQEGKESGLLTDFEPRLVRESLRVNRRTVHAPVLQLRSRGCDWRQVVCGYAVLTGREPLAQTAPDFLGGYGAWAYVRPDGPAEATLPPSAFLRDRERRQQQPMAENLLEESVGAAAERRLNDLAFWRLVSRHLPEWSYLYLPAGPLVATRGESGYLEWLSQPLLLNRGEVHRF